MWLEQSLQSLNRHACQFCRAASKFWMCQLQLLFPLWTWASRERFANKKLTLKSLRDFISRRHTRLSWRKQWCETHNGLFVVCKKWKSNVRTLRKELPKIDQVTSHSCSRYGNTPSGIDGRQLFNSFLDNLRHCQALWWNLSWTMWHLQALWVCDLPWTIYEVCDLP